MAADEQAQPCCATATATDSGGGERASKHDATAMAPVAVAASVSLCVLHDALGAALFLASHPLHAVYLVFFARGLLALAAFFWPLLASTSLLLAVLVTVGPYVGGGGGGAEWPGVSRWSLGRTCGVAVAALCAELRPEPDGGPGPAAAAGLVAQLCSFVLGPTADAASVLRVEEIMGEHQNSLLIGGAGDGCKDEPAFALPVMDYHEYIGGGTSFLDCESHGKIDEKAVISEDMKGSDPLAQQRCFAVVDALFVQEMEAEEEEEEEEESGIQVQGLILSATDEVVSDGVEEKRLECDPVSVEMKRSEPVQVLEIQKWQPVELPEIKECETVQAVQIKKMQPTLEIKKCEPAESVEIEKNELVKPRSLIAQRIKLWEAQVLVSANAAKPSVGNRDGDSVEFGLKNKPAKDAKKRVRFEAEPCDEKCGGDQQQAQVAASTQERVEQRQEEQEFKDVKEYMHSETSETEASEKCSQDLKVKAEEEITPAVVAQAEAELEQAGRKEPEQELEETAEDVYGDVPQSPAPWNGRELSPTMKSTSIAGRVHSRTSSENLLVSEGSPSRKEKEWKRTLACKLYEERMQLRLCRDRAVGEGEGSASDDMDMLWEAYEVGSGGKKGRGGKRKVKGSCADKVDDDAVEEGEEEDDDDDDDEEEGSVRQLCCLQALKFSTRKMSFGGGKPSLSKISKVLKRMTALSRMGSRRKQSE